MDRFAVILERIRMAGYVLRLRHEQYELEKRFKESVSDEEWQGYLRSKKRNRCKITLVSQILANRSD